MDAYFDLAGFWKDIRYVMALTVDDLLLHLAQAARIAKERREAAEG